MKVPTGRSHGLAHVLDWAVQRGASRERLLARVPVAPESLADRESRIPLTAYYAGLEAASDELGDPFLGLHYIASIDPSALGALGFLALASPTVGAALERIFRHHAWLSDGEVFAMEVVAGEARFRYVPWGPPRAAHGQCAEMYAADCFFGLAAQDREILRGRTVRRVSEAQRARPMLGADEALARFLEGEVESAARGFGSSGPVAEQVRRALLQSLPEGGLSLAELARKLRLSSRTLQRRLRDEGTSAARLLDELRRARAEAYLAMGLPIAEVSYLLGFGEPSVFHRAWKRWTGETPAESRVRRAGGVTE